MLLNNSTGESALTDADGNEWRVIFTEDAIMAAEAVTNASILDLLGRATTGGLRLTEVQALVWAGVNGHRSRGGSSKTITPERAMRIVRESGGMVGVMPILAESLVRCSALGFDVDDEDEDDGKAKEGSADVDPSIAESADTAQH